MSMEKALALAALAKAGQGGGGGDVSFATDAEVKAGTASDKALAPSNESAASFYGLAKAAGDSTQAASSNPVGTYTAEAQTAIKSMLGVSGGGGETWELINSVNATEPIQNIIFTQDSNGNPLNLKKVGFRIQRADITTEGIVYNNITTAFNDVSFMSIPGTTNKYIFGILDLRPPFIPTLQTASSATPYNLNLSGFFSVDKSYSAKAAQLWTAQSITKITLGSHNYTYVTDVGGIIEIYGVRA